MKYLMTLLFVFLLPWTTSQAGMGNQTKTFTTPAAVNVFTDVPNSYWAVDWINQLYAEGITGGCSTSPLQFCPEGYVTRAQMSIFLLRTIHGADYRPPASGDMFSDVPSTYWAKDWINQLYAENITSGCAASPFQFCPEDNVTRSQMAVFLLKAIHGAGYTPPVSGDVFSDVPSTYWAKDWINQLYTEGITGGCAASPLQFCPEDNMTRAQMSVFLLKVIHGAGYQPPAVTGWWHPTVGLTWQWHINGDAVDTSYDASVYDVDYLYAPQSTIDDLHSKGRKVICYMSVGSWENWRPDADLFPPEVIGNDYDGWPGEKWLDIRQIDILAPIMRARLDLCASKGFDAIEPDNMEVYTNNTGFPLTYNDQLKYALWLADEAHQRGLAIGQKNASDQTLDLVDIFDFAITEDAFFYNWTDDMKPFITAGKPVFAAEYTDLGGDFASYCLKSETLKFSLILKHRNLDAWIQTCK
jgi:hypothetical protein